MSYRSVEVTSTPGAPFCIATVITASYSRIPSWLIPFPHRTGRHRRLAAISVLLHPLGFDRNRDRLQLCLLQAVVNCRQISGQLGEVGYYVFQVVIERIRSRHLVVRGTAFVLDHIPIELADMLANALFTGDRAAFFGSNNLRAQRVGLARQRL